LLFGWVIVYEHIHLMLQPSDEFDISKVMQFLKRHTSRNINTCMGYGSESKKDTPEGTTPESDIGQCHFQEGELTEKKRIYLLQTLNTFDCNVLCLKTRFAIKHLNKNPYPKFKWQKSFIDHYERNDLDFHNHLDYIEHNPTKHDLPSDWPYVFTNPKYENLIDDIL